MEKSRKDIEKDVRELVKRTHSMDREWAEKLNLLLDSHATLLEECQNINRDLELFKKELTISENSCNEYKDLFNEVAEKHKEVVEALIECRSRLEYYEGDDEHGSYVI